MSGPARLPLHDAHSARGAAFSPLGSWVLPQHYGKPEQEAAALRHGVGVADVSHRSRLLVTGSDSPQVLANALDTGAEFIEGEAREAFTVDEARGVRDLIVIARTGAIAHMVLGDAERRAETLGHLEGGIGEAFDAAVADRTGTTCQLEVVGPRAADAVADHLSSRLVERLQGGHCLGFEFRGFRGLAIRTDPCGVPGFDFVLAPRVAIDLLETLAGAGAGPVGLRALDLIRLEAARPSVADLEPGLTPEEAGLADGPEGARALRPIAVATEGQLSTGLPVLAGRRAVGELRSSAFSEALGATVAFAIFTDQFHNDEQLTIDGHRATLREDPSR